MSRLRTFGMIGVVMCLFTGCGLLPEEEELRTAPIVSSYEAEEYNYVLAQRGDIIMKEDMSCTYQPTEEESLSFTVGGEYYGSVFVKIGDEVKKGDLLAELEMEDVLKAIEESELAINKIELQLENVDHLISIELKKLEIAKGDPGTSPTIKNYDTQKSQLREALYIAEKRRTEKEELKKQRQLVAGMDGIVSYIKVTRGWDRSVEDEEYIRIMDGNLSFTAKTKNGYKLRVGDTADILVNNEDSYPTVIQSIDQDDSGLYIVKFSLTGTTTDLPQGARGIYTLLLEEKKDVLYVPYGAVTTAGDQNIVYSVDKDGLKTIKPITIGLMADGKVEVLSGLNEGDLVILD